MPAVTLAGAAVAGTSTSARVVRSPGSGASRTTAASSPPALERAGRGLAAPDGPGATAHALAAAGARRRRERVGERGQPAAELLAL